MNPDNRDRIVGVDSLPTTADIAPAELKGLAPSQVLQGPADPLEAAQFIARNSSQGEASRGQSDFRIDKRLVLAVLTMILIGSASFAIGSLINKKPDAAKDNLSSSNFANISGPAGTVVANPQTDTLKINYDTVIAQGRTLTANGSVVIQNETDSKNAFKIQNASGSNILVADTADNQITIGDKPPGQVSLNVNGDLKLNGSLISTSGFSVSSQGLSIGGTLVCTANGCVSSNSSANSTIDAANLAYLDANQTLTGQNSFHVTSATAFQIQNSSATDSLFMVDTENNRIGIGTVPSASGATLQIAGDLNVGSGIYRIGNTAGASLVCGPNELLQQGVIQGGIVVGGTCVTVAGGTTPTLQQVYDASTPAHLTLSNGSGVLRIQDAASPLATDLFEVTNNGATTKYFAVNSLGISVTGNVNTTGQYQINGGQIASSDLADSANLAKLNANQTFSGINSFTSAANTFSGNGANLTNLNGSNVAAGTVGDSFLSSNVTKQGNSFNGNNELVQLTAGGILPILSGANLTSLNAGNISSGALSDTRLSGNVALLSSNQTFTGNNTFTLSSTALTVQDAASPLGTDLFTVASHTGATKYFEVSSTGAKINGSNVCTDAGNCVGTGGSGAIGGSGTAQTIPVFTGSGFTVGNSNLSQLGTTTNAAGNLNLTSGSQYQINGLQISSANLSNDSNLAKLNGNQTFSGNNTFNGNNSIHLNSTAFNIQDNVSPLGTTLFEVSSSGGATKYFTVSATALQFNGKDVCTTVGNCAGAGNGGGLTGSGSQNQLAKFDSAGNLVGSIISDNGSTATVAGGLSVNTITSTATLTIGLAAQTLTLQGDAGTSLSATASGITNKLVFAAPTLSNKTITIPNASGTVAVSASGPLSLDAAGNITCPNCLTNDGTGGGAGVSSVNGLNGNVGIAGTLNQINIATGGATVTLSTPQDIATTSSPQFANINVTGQYKVNGSQISSSNLSDSANIAKLNANQTFTGSDTFNNTLSAPGLTTSGANLGIGTATASLNLSGNYSSNLAVTNGTNTTTIGFSGAAVGNVTYNFDASAAAGIYTICTTANVSACTAANNVTTSSNGTNNTIAMFTGAQTIANSILTQSGTTVSAGGNLNVTGQFQVSGAQIASSNLSDGANLAKLNANQTFTGNDIFQGTVLAQHTSTSAFQIQNASSPDNLFIADTVNHRIAIDQASANYALDVAGDINTTTGYRVGSTAGAGITCSGGNTIQNAVVSGGIITGGSCVANGAGATTTLQNAYDNSSSPATITTTAAAKGITIKAGASFDSANLFQVQSAAGQSLLNIDSTTLNVSSTQANITLTGVTPTSVTPAAGSNQGGIFSGASGTTYYYKVTAIVNGLETGTSSEASFSSSNFTALTVPSAATLALAAGSNLGIGVYQYEVTYVTANGETTGGTSASITTTAGNQAVNLTAIPTGPTGTTARKIYRTVVGGSTYKLLTTLNDNSTTIYSDTTADGSLGATVPASNTARTNTNNISVSWTGITGAASYRVYRGTAAGAESAYFTSATSSYTDTGSAGTGGTPPIISAYGRLGVGAISPTASLDVRGTALFKPTTDSTTAFQIQNAAGSTILAIDTTNMLVNVNGGATYNTFSSSPGTGFGIASTYGYTTPFQAASADFNGDGFQDVATISNSTNTMSVILGNGDGTLGARSDYTTGSSPFGIAIADLNGDGYPDIVITNFSANTISVFLNNGNGTFAVRADYNAQTNPRNITIADFNGDGRPDIATINTGSNTISVFLNNGNGTFAPQTGYSTGNCAFGITSGDFDGDGRPDIAVTYCSGGNYGIEVLINNGFSFNPGVIYNFTTNSLNNMIITSTDFNGDGKPDIATTGGNDSSVSVFLNNGNGTFAAHVDYALGSVNQTSTIISADLNGDGKLDLALAEGSVANTLTTFTGNGSGTFSGRTAYSIGSANARLSGMAVADFNGDGKLDLAISDSSNKNIYIVTNGSTTLTTSHSGSLSIASTTASGSGLVIQGAAGQTGDLLRLQSSTGSELLAVSSAGILETTSIDSLNSGGISIGATAYAGISLQQSTTIAANKTFTSNGWSTFTSATNSATAFQIQNSSGLNLLSADTSNMNINVTGGNLLLNGVAPANLVTSAGTNSSGGFSGASGTIYYYQVTAIVNGQETTPSNEASFGSSNFNPISAPSTAATLALVAGSNLGVGVYQYEVTYVMANGETTGGTSASITTTAGNQAVNLTNVPVGPIGTTARKIYRTTVGGSTYKLLTTLNDNTTTIFSDTTADAGLGATVPASNTARTNTNSINLGWTAVPGATSYRIYRGTNSGLESAYQTSGANGFTDTGSAGSAGTVPTLSPFGRLGIGTTTPTASIDIVGTARFKSGTNSTTAFQIQNAVGGNLVQVDSVNSRLYLGATVTSSATTTSALTVNSDVQTSGYGISLSHTNSSQGDSSGGLSISSSNTIPGAAPDSIMDGTQLNVSRSVNTSFTSTNNPLFDNAVKFASSGGNISTISISNFVVANNPNRYLLFFANEVNGCTYSSITYNGVAMSLVGVISNMNVYGLIAPATGTHNVVVNYSPVCANENTFGAVSSWYNVNQTGPVGSFTSKTGSGTNFNMNVSTVANQVVVDALYWPVNSAAANAGQTEAVNVNGWFGRQSYMIATGATTNIGWSSVTSANYTYGAVNLISATGINPAVIIAGNLVNLQSNCTVNAGTCTDSSTVINVNQQYSGATGAVVNIQNAGNGAALQVLNGSGVQAVNVSTNSTPNLVSNGDFESTTNGWSGKGSGTISRNDTAVIGAASGVGNLKITTTALANDGVSFNYTFAASTAYTMSLYARSSAGAVSTISIGHQDVSGTDIDCLTSQSIITVWTRYTCTFTTGATVTPPTQIYIKQSDATARTFYIDGVQLEQASTASSFQASRANFQVQTATSTITLDGNNSGALGPWSTNANSLPAALWGAASVIANGYVYYIGGATSTVNGSSNIYYSKLNADGSVGSWTTNASTLSSGPRFYLKAVTANGYIYVMGGQNNSGGANSDVYTYRINADGSLSVVSISDPNVPSTPDDATSVIANGYIYSIGGGTNVYYAKLNANGSVGSWATSSNPLPQSISKATSVIANGYVYVMGGTSISGTVSTVYYAKLNTDGSTGAWSTNINALPTTATWGATSAVSNGYVYFMGGTTTFGGGNSSAVYYAKLNSDGSTGAWTNSSNVLPQTRNTSTSVSANGYIYVLGGSTFAGGGQSNGQSTVYYASGSRLQIGANLDLVGLQGGTLSDPGDQSLGSNGGSITAGNGIFVGSLQVQGQGSFAQGVSISGNLSVAGTAAFQSSTNSITAFQVQNTTSSPIFDVDTVNGRVGIDMSPSYALDVTGQARFSSNVSIGTANPINLSDTLAVGQTFNSASQVEGLDVNINNSGVGPNIGLNVLTNNGGTGNGDLTGIQVGVRELGAATATSNGIGLLVNGPDAAAGGTITNAYGIQIQAQKSTGITNAYGIYQVGANDLNYFAGKTGIGGSPANGALTVGTNTTIASGGLYFGTDTDLYRASAGVLFTDNSFQSALGIYSRGGTGFSYNPTTATANVLTSQVQGAPNPLFITDVNGKLQWGAGGASAIDTNLYRGSAGKLVTDGGILIGGGITNAIQIGAVGGGNFILDNTGKLLFSALNAGTFDTNLYRSAAGTLATDGVFNAGTLQQGGTGVILTTASAGGGVITGTFSNLQIATGAVTSTSLLDGTILNADIATSASIAYSKLNLAGSIVNADISSSAAISYSKLNLAGSIVNADISASAAIAYSKLSLAGSIVNSDISSSAAIDVGKLSYVGVKATKSGGVAIGNGSETILSLPTEDWDTASMHSTVSNTHLITIPTTGKYRITAWSQFGGGSGSGSGIRNLYLYSTAQGLLRTNTQLSPGAGWGTYNQIDETFQLTAGDTVYISVYQNSGNNPITLDSAFLLVERLN